VWDLSATLLCRKHLLGEHAEIHALFSILASPSAGYRNHPETRRWLQRRGALRVRHDEVAREMMRRGYQHRTPAPGRAATRTRLQDRLVDSLETQVAILRAKPCACRPDQPMPALHVAPGAHVRPRAESP
jgi:hypothetical protein